MPSWDDHQRPTLNQPPPQPETLLAVMRLTLRQKAVYEEVRAHPGGVTADEAGAAAHTVPGPRGGRTHGLDERCEWCASEGLRILEQLISAGLVRRRRSGVRGVGYLYVIADGSQSIAGYDPATVPWPEGF